MNRRKYLLLVTSLAEVKYPDPANSLYSVGDLREARVEASSNRAGYITAKMEDYDLIQVLVNGLVGSGTWPTWTQTTVVLLYEILWSWL